MKTKLWIIALVVALLSGCATLSPQEIASTPVFNLCLNYSDSQDPNVRAELVRRGVFTPSEWQAIDQRTVIVGEGIGAVICTFGIPDAQNQTVYQGDSSTQYVYNIQEMSLLGSSIVTLYVYVNQSGSVTAVQESN